MTQNEYGLFHKRLKTLGARAVELIPQAMPPKGKPFIVVCYPGEGVPADGSKAGIVFVGGNPFTFGNVGAMLKHIEAVDGAVVFRNERGIVMAACNVPVPDSGHCGHCDHCGHCGHCGHCKHGRDAE